MLQPQLGIALVRLPYFALQPVTPEDSLDVALLVNAPQDKRRAPIDEQIEILTRQILEASDRYTIVHLFTNQRLYRILQGRLDDRHATETGSGVRLYDPNAAAAEKGGDRFGYARSQNSWLRWVREALAGRSVDVAHFVGLGYFSMNQGALDLAETPLNEDAQGAAGFVEAQELVHFLTHIGAWAVGFSAAPHNLSPMGLRLLADQVARLRPGPVFLHEAADDHDGSAVHATYHFLFGHGERPLPRSSAVGLYCHPKYVEAIHAEEESPVDAKLRQFSFAGPPTVEIIEAPTNTPTWIASSQRYIEQTAAKMAEQEPNSAYQNATQAGIEEALRFVSDVIARHAQEPTGVKEPEAGA